MSAGFPHLVTSLYLCTQVNSRILRSSPALHPSFSAEPCSVEPHGQIKDTGSVNMVLNKPSRDVAQDLLFLGWRGQSESAQYVK